MATTRKRKTKAASSPLTITLKDTRLKKFLVEILLSVEEAGQGSMLLSYNISTPPAKDFNSYPAILKIEGKGVNKEDPSKVAFIIDAEMIGIFSLSHDPNDAELKTASIDMANFIVPVLSDTIETAMFKSGYPRLKIPKSFPQASN